MRRRPISVAAFAAILLMASSSRAVTAAGAKSAGKPPDLSACGGNEWISYLGKPAESMRQKNPANTRFICEKECAVTADYRADRLNVMYSRKTDLILSMHCG